MRLGARSATSKNKKLEAENLALQPYFKDDLMKQEVHCEILTCSHGE